MRCDSFVRWLDEGMAASHAAQARAHARACPACAGRLGAAGEVEASLRAAPPAPPPGFTAAVLAAIETLERTEPARAGAPARLAAPWWVVVGSEPAFWVGVGVAATLLPLRGATPRLGSALAALAETALSAWAASASAWASRIPALLPSLDPAARAAVAAGLALPLLWLLYRAPIWMAESWGRRAGRSARGPAPPP